MQSLALDIQVMSEEGGALEVAEEEDDLLRAAEELGIDLTARFRAEERAAEAQAALVSTHTGSELDEEPDDEEESDEFEAAPEIETHEIDLGGVGLDLDADAELSSHFADDAE
jgi:DNA-directed RNA polymerase subunit beta